MLHVKDEEEPTDHMLLHFDKARITRQLIFLIGIVSKKQSPIRVTILTRHRSFIGKCRKQPRENWRKEFLVYFFIELTCVYIKKG